MSGEDLCFSTLHQLSEGLRRHKFSPVEVVETHLRRCERLNPLLNAFITLAAESALEAARQAEREIASGNYRGPLHGIPIERISASYNVLWNSFKKLTASYFLQERERLFHDNAAKIYRLL